MSENGQKYLKVKIASYDSLDKIVEQLLKCDFHDEIGHPLKNNIAFIALEKMAEGK